MGFKYGYGIVAALSWLLISGWMFADLTTPDYEWEGHRGRRLTREDSAFSVALSAPLAGLWPIGVPLAFCLTSYAADGWRAPWDLSDEVQ